MESFRYENVPLPPNQLPLLVFEREHDSGGPGCEFHWHQELEFYYVITGGVLLSCGGEQEWLYPGDIGFVNSYLPHRGLDFLNGTRHYIIQINLDMLEGEICFSQNRSYSSLLLEKLRELPPFLREDPELTSLFSSLVQEWKGQKPGMELAAKGLLFQILVRLLRTAPQPSSAKNSGSWEPRLAGACPGCAFISFGRISPPRKGVAAGHRLHLWAFGAISLPNLPPPHRADCDRLSQRAALLPCGSAHPKRGAAH